MVQVFIIQCLAIFSMQCAADIFQLLLLFLCRRSDTPNIDDREGAMLLATSLPGPDMLPQAKDYHLRNLAGQKSRQADRVALKSY